ncbi:class I SAM-dependent methyltransferase [Edaphobacter aggregans]|uniref:class I SAM-dependent methyltransferase n=1 Tax=Edaphobacter aggregans TaxID=570835 RepID=UPI00068ED583|nr:class I SAM-dependent methyltransferase [Edaphobacter aggregans]
MIDQYSLYRLLPAERIFFAKYYKPGDSVLDHACGAGRTTLRLHEIGFRVKGIDTSENLIHVAQRRFPYIPFEVGSYCEIEEPDQSYDHVLISFNSLDCAWPEHRRVDALRECRVLKPAGTLIFSWHNIKAFHISPVYLQRENLAGTAAAFRDQAYVRCDSCATYFAAPDYVIDQTEKVGFRYLEQIGVRKITNPMLNRYVSPYVYYAFRKV